MALTFSVIVCAHNEAQYVSACLQSLLAQSRLPDKILVINNASTDETRAVALAFRRDAGDPEPGRRMQVPHVRVVDEPRKGLVVARETGRRVATGDVLVYLDADCRAPLTWLARIERRFMNSPALLALSGPYRYYDWDWWGRLLVRAYDFTLAPATQVLVKHVLRIGTVFYGGNFAVRRDALDRIGGFDTSIEFHGEDTNLGRRLFAVGKVGFFLMTLGQRAFGARQEDFDAYLKDVQPEARRALETCHPHHRTTRRLEIRTCYLWDHRKELSKLVDVWEAANRDDLFSVTSLKHYPYVANSDFHKPKHLYSWKTLLRCEKNWPAIKEALRRNVDVALTLFRNGAWAA